LVCASIFLGCLVGMSNMMTMIISPFGQHGLWAPSSCARDVFASMAYVFT
jgi:hypothetical protein